MKKYSVFILLIVAISLTGCGMTNLNMTDEQTNIAAEYMAGLVLKHDDLYYDKLTYQEPAASEAPSAFPESTAAATSGPESTAENNTGLSSGSMDTTGEATATASPTAAPTVSATTDMAGIYQDDTIHVTFSDYHLYDSYPKDTNSIKLNAQKGNKLIVIAFHIKNNTDKEQKINFMKDKIKYQLHIDNDMVYTPAITPLSNDIQYIETTIQPHKTKKALLVFEIIDQSRFNSIQLSLTKADQTAVINLN